MTKAKKLSDDELKALVDQEVSASAGYAGKLSEQRRRALDYYMAKATGDLSPPEVEGRSSIVSPDVAEAIEGAMPSLMRIFCSGDEVVRFEAKKPGDEDKAQLATEYVNWLFWTQNEGWKVVYWWIKDALLSKNGVVKVFCDESKEVTEETYVGLTENQMASLAGDDEVKVISHSETPDEVDAKHREEAQQQLAQMAQQLAQIPPQGPQGQPNPQALQLQQQMQQITQALSAPPSVLHDITIRRTKQNRAIRIANVPPEEFLISRHAKSVDDTPFIGHMVQKTLYQLIADGYDKEKVMALTDETSWTAYNSESLSRRINDDDMGVDDSDNYNTDPLSRRVWLIDCFIRADVDGDGYAEWRHILKAGFEILENEMCDGPDFADMTPVLMPHRFHGLSMADQAMDFMKVKTVLLRQFLDALYLGNNPRYEAVEGQVNFDDLLTSRPGGVVRVKQVGQVASLMTQDVSQSAINGIEFFDSIIRNRTGVSEQNAGPDADAVNQTATKANMVQNASMQKLELVARAFAETGFKRLFRLILKAAIRYQDKPQMVKLSGKWVEIDPQEWRDGFDMAISVGLGTGNRDQQEAQLHRLLQVQTGLMQFGVVQPANLFQTAKKLPNILGYKDDDKYFTDPTQNPPPQHPNPEVIKAQAQQQIAQTNAQTTIQVAQQKGQIDMQLAREKNQLDMQRDINEQQAQQAQAAAQMQQEAQLKAWEAQLADARERHQAEIDAQLEQMKAESQERTEAMKAEYARQTAITVAEIHARSQIESAELSAQTTLSVQQGKAAQEGATPDEPVSDPVSELGEQIKTLSAPRTVERDESGKVVGSKAQQKPEEKIAEMQAEIKRLSAPKTVVRDVKTGKATGIEHGGKVRKVVRDGDGRITGLE